MPSTMPTPALHHQQSTLPFHWLKSCRFFFEKFWGIQKPWIAQVFGEIHSTWTLLAYTTSSAHIPQSPMYPAATSHKLNS